MTDDPKRPEYILRLRPAKGCDELRAMKRLLKFAWRSCRLKCTEVRPAVTGTQPSAVDKARGDQ